MIFELIFDVRAEKEAKAALYYYDQINIDLGARFLDELIVTYHKIAANPQHYSFISSRKKSKLRDTKLPSFPYVVIFKISGNTVHIVAVMSTYRKPFVT